jgi:hypothetical protein
LRFAKFKAKLKLEALATLVPILQPSMPKLTALVVAEKMKNSLVAYTRNMNLRAA